MSGTASANKYQQLLPKSLQTSRNLELEVKLERLFVKLIIVMKHH